MQEDLVEYMSFKNHTIKPLFVAKVNGRFIIAAYQGALSKYDILVKYRQNVKGKWSRLRTPKHIHWAVDIMIKMHFDNQGTQEFLDFLLQVWETTVSIEDEQARNEILNLESLLSSCQKEILQYEKLGEKGEYSIKFLILLAKLLMLQEKTNLKKAYMFRRLLEALKKGEDIFKIVSTAAHRGR